MTETPRQRRRAKNEATILDATADLIVARGFENVSLREIAKHADYSPAGLYKYFDSKAAILVAVVDRANQQLLDLLAAVPTDQPPAQRLIELCMLYIQFNLENRVYLTLINNLTTERTTKQQPVSQGSPYLVFLQAVGVWVEAETITLTDDYHLEEITYALWAQTHGMATLLLNQLKDFEADFENANRRTLEFFLDGLRQRK